LFRQGVLLPLGTGQPLEPPRPWYP
jgi:hypothetical protein